MTIKYYDSLKEAIQNYRVKHEIVSNKWWIFINYKGRVYYDQSHYDPRENAIAKEAMIKNIRNEAEILDWHEANEKKLKAKYNY